MMMKLSIKKIVLMMMAVCGVMLSAAIEPAHAQLTPVGEAPQGQNIRRFPDRAERASDFMVTQWPQVRINGQDSRLAASSRIYNEKNLIVMPASLTGMKLVVNYTKDFDGAVKDVWILTNEEMNLKAPNVLKAERDKALQQQMSR